MKRIFKDGLPHHVYCKGVNGNVIFYSTADCIFFFTLYSCLSRKYGIRTGAFSIMPNHTHSQQEAQNQKTFIAFNRECLSTFTRGYNSQHRRSGELFQSPFGSAPKMVGKTIKSNISYINNNGTSGRLSKGVLDYRWNLMAYYFSSHPFSEKIIQNRASKRMREALRFVDRCRQENKPLDYKLQSMLFKGLNTKERKQLLDYIIYRYNFLDYNAILKHYKSMEEALMAMDANTGSEHDLKEDWEDYSVYRRMIEKAACSGIEMETVNFEGCDKDELFTMAILLSGATGEKKKVGRFLHLDPKKQPAGDKETIEGDCETIAGDSADSAENAPSALSPAIGNKTAW